jgi:hypothetical protein
MHSVASPPKAAAAFQAVGLPVDHPEGLLSQLALLRVSSQDRTSVAGEPNPVTAVVLAAAVDD